MTDTPRRIIHDAKAWQEGFAAGRRGLKWNANPMLRAAMPRSAGTPGWLREGRSHCDRSTIDSDAPKRLGPMGRRKVT
jgi:hypothetical protein